MCCGVWPPVHAFPLTVFHPKQEGDVTVICCPGQLPIFWSLTVPNLSMAQRVLPEISFGNQALPGPQSCPPQIFSYSHCGWKALHVSVFGRLRVALLQESTCDFKWNICFTKVTGFFFLTHFYKPLSSTSTSLHSTTLKI